MPRIHCRAIRRAVIGSVLVLSATALPAIRPAHAAEADSDKAAQPDVKLSPPIEKGQRVFTAGHSFHVFMPHLLAQVVKAAGIPDHVQVGMSSIGGSKIFQHWDVP